MHFNYLVINAYISVYAAHLTLTNKM